MMHRDLIIGTYSPMVVVRANHLISKRFGLVILFVLMSLFLFAQTPPDQRFNADSFHRAKIQQAIGTPFSSFTAINENGPLNNDSLKGKVVLINFWFEGCIPCLAEFPALNELADSLRCNKDFRFISFTWDNPQTIKRVKEKYKLQFEVFYSKECSRLNLRFGYPTSMILDRDGKIKFLESGGSVDPVKAREFVMNTLLSFIEKEL